MVADLGSSKSGANAADFAGPSPQRIQVVESSPDRLVVYLPHCASIGMLRVARALMQVALGLALCVTFGRAGIGLSGWLLVAMAAAISLRGLATLAEWSRQRLTQMYLSVEEGRLVVQRILLGRKQIHETILGPRPAAEIVTQMNQGGTIHVNGVAGKEEFGAWLDPREQQWLIQAVNRLNVTNASPPAAVRLANGLLEEVPRPVGRDELRLIPRIDVKEASNDRLCYRRRILGASWRLYPFLIVQICAFAFTELELRQGNALGAGWQWFLLAVVVPFFEVSLFLLCVCTLLGTFTIDLTPDWLVADWRFGPVRVRRRLATDSISRIVIRYGVPSPGRLGFAPTGGLAMCLAVDGKQTFTLNSPGDLSTARRVGGILRHELARMGRPTDDV
jgi:hypothetical protein